MTLRLLALSTCLALFACDGDGTPTESDTPIDCPSFGSLFPQDMGTNVYYRTAITFDVEDETSPIDVSLSTGGTDVPGSGTLEGKRYTFVPDAPLESSTTYDLSVSVCEGETTETSFTTSEVGAATATTDLTDKTYSLDLAAQSVQFVQPQGVGPLLQAQLGDLAVLVGVRSIMNDDLLMLGAIGDSAGAAPVQDVCVESIDFPVADFAENPYFELGPQTTTISAAGISVEIQNLFISGAFAPDGSEIVGAVLEGKIDTRPLAGLVGEEDDPDAVCDLASSTIGIECEDCGNGEAFCLSLVVTNIGGEDVDGLVLEERSAADIAADTVRCPPE